jgi:hypothetical protein
MTRRPLTDAEPPARGGESLDLRRFARKLVLGDWHPLLRDPLDVMRLSFAVAAVLFGLAGSLEYSVRMAGTFRLVLMAANLRQPRPFRPAVHRGHGGHGVGQRARWSTERSPGV